MVFVLNPVWIIVRKIAYISALLTYAQPAWNITPRTIKTDDLPPPPPPTPLAPIPITILYSTVQYTPPFSELWNPSIYICMGSILSAGKGPWIRALLRERVMVRLSLGWEKGHGSECLWREKGQGLEALGGQRGMGSSPSGGKRVQRCSLSGDKRAMGTNAPGGKRVMG